MSVISRLQSNLNSQQLAVVDWILNGRGSLNLVARAGCGKTYTLVQGAVRAIVEADLGEVALMAYNKDAAGEFKQRLQKMADDLRDPRYVDWRRVDAGTVHSFGFRAVRKWAPGVQVDDRKVAKIVDDFAERDSPADGRPSVYAAEKAAIVSLVSLAKQAAFGFLKNVDDRRAWFDIAEHHAIEDQMGELYDLSDVIAASIRTLRESIRQDRSVVDFDDMILAPLVHNIRMWPKDWVLLDEAQDTNPARRALALKLLKPQTGRLIAVGDDRQAIYGFTGADSDALDLIARELGSKTLPLSITYRCPKAVVAEANRLVPDLQAHETAPEGEVLSIRSVLTIDLDRGNGDVGEQEVVWYDLDEFRPVATDAILCRNTKPLIELAYALLARGIGCRVEGREIGEGLVVLATRWKRIKTIVALIDKLVEYRDREVQKWSAKGREDRAQGIEDKVEAVLAISRALQNEGKTEVADVVEWIRGLFGDTKPGEVPSVATLSTIHKAKGREWDRVFILSRSTTLPSKWARKEWQLRQEENLEYVAITRAKRSLIFVD